MVLNQGSARPPVPLGPRQTPRVSSATPEGCRRCADVSLGGCVSSRGLVLSARHLCRVLLPPPLLQILLSFCLSPICLFSWAYLLSCLQSGRFSISIAICSKSSCGAMSVRQACCLSFRKPGKTARAPTPTPNLPVVSEGVTSIFRTLVFWAGGAL